MIIPRLAIALMALSLAACESTKQASTAEPAGFLMNYNQLAPGEDGDFTLAYWDGEADVSGYDKVLVDPVTVWLSEESELRDVPAEEREELANTFYRTLIEELGEDYEIVQATGPDVLKIRVAITDAAKSNIFLDTVSTFSWQVRILSEAAALNQEMAFFVGDASAEFEVKDGVTGDRIGAAVDKRIGRRAIGNTLNSWGDAEGSFEAWARQLRNRLRVQSGKEPVPLSDLEKITG